MPTTCRKVNRPFSLSIGSGNCGSRTNASAVSADSAPSIGPPGLETVAGRVVRPLEDGARNLLEEVERPWRRRLVAVPPDTERQLVAEPALLAAGALLLEELGQSVGDEVPVRRCGKRAD